MPDFVEGPLCPPNSLNVTVFPSQGTFPENFEKSHTEQWTNADRKQAHTFYFSKKLKAFKENRQGPWQWLKVKGGRRSGFGVHHSGMT
jgi:hypothetical protein